MQKSLSETSMPFAHLIVWNGVLPEEIGRDEAHLVAEEGRAVLEQRREDAVDHPFEAPGVLGRDAIPGEANKHH